MKVFLAWRPRVAWAPNATRLIGLFSSYDSALRAVQWEAGHGRSPDDATGFCISEQWIRGPSHDLVACDVVAATLESLVPDDTEAVRLATGVVMALEGAGFALRRMGS